MAKKIEEQPYKFLKPEEIDNIIIAHLNASPRRGGKSVKAKWSEMELKYRRQVIIEYICQGLSNRRVKEEIMARWGIAQGTADIYLKDAIDSLTPDNEAFIEHARQVQLERLNDMMENFLRDGMIDAAMKCMEMMNKINGLYETKQKLEVSGDLHFEFGGDLVEDGE